MKSQGSFIRPLADGSAQPMTNNHMTPEQVAAGLIPLERERLTGWQGPSGAAYNAISEDMCESGLLNADWSLSPLGLAVREILKTQEAGDAS